MLTHMSNQTGTWTTASEYGRLHVTDLQHDAAMAHALVMAMERWDYSDDPNDTINSAIFRRADEIMAEWGYE